MSTTTVPPWSECQAPVVAPSRVTSKPPPASLWPRPLLQPPWPPCCPDTPGAFLMALAWLCPWPMAPCPQAASGLTLSHCSAPACTTSRGCCLTTPWFAGPSSTPHCAFWSLQKDHTIHCLSCLLVQDFSVFYFLAYSSVQSIPCHTSPQRSVGND